MAAGGAGGRRAGSPVRVAGLRRHERLSTPTDPGRQRWILAAVVLGSGIVFLDGTIVNVALPRMGRELPATFVGVLEGQAYITSGYLAVLAALLIVAGALADRYGRRRIFVIGLVSFGVISALCGLAPTMEFEIVFRLLQGAAGALLVPGSLSLITANFDGAARGRAFGVWAASTSALTIIGPIIGGALVDLLSWRVAFLINVPLVIVALYATLRHVPESRDEDAPEHIDILGAIVIAIAVGGISFGLIRGQERQWNDALAFAALGIGIVAAILFPILMVTRPDPLVPPELFKSREFTVINLSTFLIYGALYATISFQSLFLQGVLGYTALAASAIGLPSGILLSLGSTRVGAVAGRVGPRRFLAIGPLLMAGGLLWFARAPATSEPWTLQPGSPQTYLPPMSTIVDVLPAIVAFGVGITLVVAPLTTALMNSVPMRHVGLGSAINNSVSRVGQPLLMAVLFIVISATFYQSVGTQVPALDTSSAEGRQQVQPLNPPPSSATPEQAAIVNAASTDAFHLAMFVSALLLIGGAAVNRFGLQAGVAGEAQHEPRSRASDAVSAGPAA
jgi:EmrB/QacA subfamily drug resistance transporter